MRFSGEGYQAGRKREDRAYSLDSVLSHGDRVIVAFSWSDKEGRRRYWAQGLRLKDGKIIEMQDFANPWSAFAVIRLRTPFG